MSARQGAYRILEEGRDAGIERWSLSEGPGAVSFASTITRSVPDARQDDLSIRLSPDWLPRSLTASVRSPSGERRYHGRRVGEEWVSQVVSPGAVETVTLPFSDTTHVDYFTPHTNSITIHRLALAPGEARDVEVVYIAFENLAPSLVRQRYERLPCDPAEAARQAGDARATQCYRYTGLDTGFTATIWTDDAGIVIHYARLFTLLPR